MIAVKGIYQGGGTVQLSVSSVPVQGPYEVEVTFLNPVQKPDNSSKMVEEKHTRRQEAFHNFMQYRGTLPANFDFKKELAEYRNEHYGHID